jgi:hypothetical protein
LQGLEWIFTMLAGGWTRVSARRGLSRLLQTGKAKEPPALLRPVPHVAPADLTDEPARTEDVKFSPSGRILAMVSTAGRMFLFTVDTRSRPIRVERYMELESTSLCSPHGVDFLAEDIVAVANRSGCMGFCRVPPVDAWVDCMPVEPFQEMDCAWFGRKGSTRPVDGRHIVCGPGSVRADGKQLLVGCNNLSTVTAHPYRLERGTIETEDPTVTARDGLEIIDGVALSHDGRWFALSEHHYGRVMIYRSADKTLSAVLRDPDLHHPHGLCFSRTGRTLCVSDAEERYLHVFCGSGKWDKSMDESTFKLAAVEEEAYRKTKESTPEQFRSLEGGIKGVDIDPSDRIVATTCQNQMLRFFELETASCEITSSAISRTSRNLIVDRAHERNVE